jgi:tRNA threonylcarbamoyladenosine biosynthesis protein TsaE
VERHLTKNPEDTERLAAELAASLRPGDVVLVSGDLGAGKTTFVRGAARGLGVTEPVTSPTFTIGQRYTGRIPVSHLDLYRLAEGGGGLDDEDPGLLDDYLTPDAIAFVEWPQAGTTAFGRVVLRVSLAHEGGERRRIEVQRCR